MFYQLRITEVFYSLQGESSLAGLPTVFIRLTGCPLRCGYCDTAYAFKGGEWVDAKTILQRVAAYDPKYICVTGGEPLAQKDCGKLLFDLCEKGYEVSLETSGAVSVEGVDERVKRVVDIKTPGSGEVKKNLYENIDLLNEKDEVKFVLCDRGDYDWAKQIMQQYHLTQRCPILFSPSANQLSATELGDWIVEDRLPVRFQTQLHKILWGSEVGR